MLVDYHIHALGHRGGNYHRELLGDYLAVAVQQGIQEVGFSEHDNYLGGMNPREVAAAARCFPGLQARLGLEVSYRPGREKEISALTRECGFDYLIGSVHEIGDWMFDHPDYRSGYDGWDISELYQAYFNLVEQMASSGLFDIVGHLDLIKVFGYRPPGDILSYAGGALRAIAATGMVVEVNTAGLSKPCRDIYPARELLERCFELGIPVTLGSDAHLPEQVGREFSQARELIHQIGYRKLTRLANRQKSWVYL